LIEQVDNHREVIMSIAERLQEKGREEGIQQGILQGMEKGMQEGEKQASINIARTLLKNGVNIELIMESTGLSRKELLSLQ
ncbi:transposase, partial [Xenorhabdus sp. ZM]|nr:transposase [Xenorhabdus sp. 38]MBD2804403.1 transposase [Xenorhabdus sp. ZM]